MNRDWQVTAKAGLSYQFDLRNTGAATYRDFAGESTVYNGKDGRMLILGLIHALKTIPVSA